MRAQLRGCRQPGSARRLHGGDFAQTIPIANGTWAELGIYNQSSTPIALSTSNANNALFLSGAVVMDDPTPPSLALSGSVPAFVGSDALAFHFAASDSESRAGLVSWALDGAGGGALVGDGCADVFVCGTSSIGDFAVAGLTGVADGHHLVTVFAHSPGGDVSQTVAFVADHTPPVVASALSVDYETRSVSVLARDVTSGIGSATLFADGAPLPTMLTVAAGEPAGTLVLSATIPLGARLDGATIDVVASDSATPASVLDTRAAPAKHLLVPVRPPPTPTSAGSETAGAAGATQSSLGAPVAGAQVAAAPRAHRAGTSLSVRLRRAGAARDLRAQRLRLGAGAAIETRGRLRGVAGRRRLVVQLGGGAQKQLWRTWTRTDGSYRIAIQPRVGGDLVVAYRGSATAMPARRLAAHLTLVPRIVARFTATRVPGGYRRILARGRFAPAGSEHVQLVWQARAPGGSWQLVGGLSSRIRPDRDGRLRGRLDITLRTTVQVRLVYLPGTAAPLAGAASRAEAPILAAG